MPGVTLGVADRVWTIGVAGRHAGDRVQPARPGEAEFHGN
jgi:hypothetical protein